MAKRNTINLSLGTTKILPAIKDLQDMVARISDAAQKTTPLPSSAYPYTVPMFGTQTLVIDSYPNDVIRLDVFNAADLYLESNYRVQTATKRDTEVTLNVEQDVKDLGYISGLYKVDYKFHRNYLGSGDGHKIQVQEISSDGLEIRVVPVLSDTLDNTKYNDFFQSGFFEIPKSQVLTNLFLFKQTATDILSFSVFDYVQDAFTISTPPYSIIIKLTTPLTNDVQVGDRLWLAQEVNGSVKDSITIVPPKENTNQVLISGPNWDVLNKTQTTTTTNYKDWDDLLTTNTETTQDIVNKLLSGSLLEGIPLNVDFRSFDNFITFGSAVERLENFKYKKQLIESYDARIALLTTDLNALPSSSVSSSLYFTSNVTSTKAKRDALIGSFDAYEKYLYNESSSYESSSYGEFYPTTWPKSNSTKPYTNYSVTSSQVENWFEGVISSASLFDQNNDKALYRLIPDHVLRDPANEEYALFVNMIGHYYDLQFAYIKQMTSVYDRHESVFEGFSKDLVFNVAQNLGIDFENGNTLEELWNYALGTDSTGSLVSSYDATPDQRTKEIWKRIINNLPYLLKTKGTERGIRALINCYGIPQTILRIREFGGSEPDFTTKTDLQYERFNYGLNLGWNGVSSGSLVGIYGTSLYGSGYYVETNPSQVIRVPWRKLVKNTLVPLSVQLRVKMAQNQTKNQTIFEVPGEWKVQAFKSGSNDYVGFFLEGTQGWATASVSSSIYDGTYHNITLQRSVASDSSSTNQTYKLIVKKVNYDKVVATQTASLYINGSTSGSYNTSFTSVTDKFLWIPGSGSVTLSQSQSMALFTGSIQELRYWAATLEDSILDNHALTPTSYQGNTDGVYAGSTSSYYDLALRFCFGSDNKKTAIPSLSASWTSQHPNQQDSSFTDGALKVATFDRFYSGSSYDAIVERHSLEWPDLGANRSLGSKIRIDNNTTIGDTLYTDVKIQRSSMDENPPDSSRLGIYLSPQNEINQDIAEQFGGISIDDYIGDPSYLTLDHYPGLDRLKYEYSKKFTQGRNNAQNYIRLIRYFDASLFQLIKKFVPYRANTQVGLVIEPTMIERSKIATNVPSFEELQYSSSIDLSPETFISVGGFVEDGDGEPFRDQQGYVPDGVIDQPFVEVSAEAEDLIEYVLIDGTDITPAPNLSLSTANEYNNTGVANDPSVSGSTFTEIDLGISQYGRDVRVLGSQYDFFTYTTSGSGASHSLPFRISSSRYDYAEALGPVIMTSNYSVVSNVGGSVYDTDIFFGRAFGDYTVYSDTATSATVTTITSSAAYDENRWLNQYGLRVVSLYTGSIAYSTPLTSSGYWTLSSSDKLAFFSTVFGKLTSSLMIPAFFYEQADPSTYDYLYEISINTYFAFSNTLQLHFGGLDCGLSQSINNVTGLTKIITKANGNWLGLRLFSNTNNGYEMSINSLKVRCLNYHADVQDFHLRDSYGMRNARYDGCKLTSPDYNVDSEDTIDGGPVITITVGGGKELKAKPVANKGNFLIQ